MPDEIKKKPSRIAVRRIGTPLKKPTVTRTAGAVNKPNVAAREEHALEGQVKALKKLPQGPTDAAEKQAKASKRKNELLAVQLNAMVAENRRLAYSIETAKKDMEKYRELYLKVREEVRAAREEAEVANKARLEAERARQHLQAQNERLESQLAANNTALKETGRAPFLTADMVAGMVSDLTDQLSDAMSGLNVKDIELKLKVGFGGAGDKRGFILPTAESGPEIKDSLHEIVIRFDRSSLES